MLNSILMLPQTLFSAVVILSFLSLFPQPIQAVQVAHFQQTGINQGAALPDLIVEQIVVTPPNPGPGSVGNIEVTVKNIGDAPVTDFDVYLYVDPIDNPPTTSTPETTHTFYGLDPLAPGATWRFARTGHVFTRANPKIYAWVDRNNQVTESNESNNLFPTPAPQGIDGFEPDDTCASAKAVVVNADPQIRTLFRQNNQPDVDWAKFDAKAGVVYVASVIPVGVDADVVLEPRNHCDSPPGLGAGQTFTVTALSNNTYYLKIYHKSSDYGPDNAYKLVVKSDERCTRFEPNNACSVASELYAGGDAITGTFCVADDVDWYRFEVQAGGRYTVTTSNVGSKANVQMQLYESCNANASNSGLQLPFTASQKGYVYLRTQNQDPQSAGVDTNYRLLVQADNSGRCQEDRFEQNSIGRDDNRANAQTINIDDDQPQIHNFCPAGDVDWVKFTANAGITYTIETFDLASAADTKLCLYDGAGKELTCDDDSGAGLGSRLVFKSVTSGDYYLSVKAVNAGVAGGRTQYSLHILTHPCTQDAQEPDNERALAKPIATDNTLQMHTICGAGDVDWVKFDALANTPYIIETTNLQQDADTVVELYDSTGIRLAGNDDYTDGVASLINYTFPNAGSYYVKVRLYNPTLAGEGTGYGLRIRPGTFIANPAPPNGVSGSSQNQPPAAGTQTLILVNQTRLTQLYGASSVQALLAKLDELARHPNVQGEVVYLDQIPDIQDAYTSWLADIQSVGKANQTADAIRRAILRYRDQHGGLQYLVLVGDDRALPFYRLPDRTDATPEKSYTGVIDTYPTGAALRQNYYLSDDYYAEHQASPNVPDLAIGRLVETPTDIIQFINRFLANPKIQIDHALVTGWTFVTDVATENCSLWRKMLNDNNQTKVNCDLIGEGWVQQQFRAARLQTNPVYTVQSINGHAAHFIDETPEYANFNAQEIENTAIDFGGGLIYSLGCHGGLNVPPENSDPANDKTLIPLDFPEVFIRKGANYIGNTGFGYGQEGIIVLSEQMVQFYTDELAHKASFGQALMKAKQRYYQQLGVEPSALEQKVLQQFVYYGLPMFESANILGSFPGDPFPDVDFNLEPATLAASNAITTIRSAQINFQKGKIQTVKTADGEYLTLDTHAQGTSGQPILPLYYKDLGQPNAALRSVIIRSATYSITTGVDPVILTPYNEYMTSTTELPLDTSAGWYPRTPLRVQTLSNEATLTTQVAQYNPSTAQLRQFTSMQVDLVFSTATDHTSPVVTVIDGLYNPSTGQVTVKVGATASTGIQLVNLSYTQDEQAKTGTQQSIQLQFDPQSRKWIGSFPGNEHSRFFAQVLDRSGNITIANNKGNYFAPALETGMPDNGYHIFLPSISR